MLVVILTFVVSLAVLLLGGDLLVRGASALAQRLGISALVIGLTVVAFGTSAPELVVSLRAALSGYSDISIGNVVGSNIANVALILGMTALFRPLSVQSQIVRFDAPVMVVASILLLVAARDNLLSRPEGILFIGALVAYLGYSFWQSRREDKDVKEEFDHTLKIENRSLLVASAMGLGGLVLLIAAGHFMVQSAVEMASFLGLSEATIGLTVVAVGTSLPEMATSLIAARKGNADMAIGNILGSNIFNILGILGISSLVFPLSTIGVTRIDLGTMLILAIVLIPFLFTRMRLSRIEGGLLLASYVAYSLFLLSA